MSEKQYRDKIAAVHKQQAEQEAIAAKARAAASKYRADAAKETERINARTSESSARMYRRNAENYLRKAGDEDKKVTAATKKLGQLSSELSSAHTNLDREVQASARRAEQRRKQEEQSAEQRRKQMVQSTERADTRRRQAERAHAQELARLSRPTIRHVHEMRVVPEPKPEMLRVLYLTANPDMNLRTEAEVRAVREAIQRATLRGAVTVDFRSAATPEDLLHGLNETRPHVVHFSGHAGDATLLFDNASVDSPEGRDLPYALLARALGATDLPPVMLVLNGCNTLDDAEVLLEPCAVVVATASWISDLAATLFAARFYAAIAEAQPIAAALAQGSVAVDMAGLEEGWKPRVLARPDVDIERHVLVQARPVPMNWPTEANFPATGSA
jgi:hypothetical protein